MAYRDDPVTQRANLAYIKHSMKLPLLKREEEFALAKRWREDQDERALHELIRAYTRLVISIAGRFRHYGLAPGDLVQEGNVGLMQAAARFEPERDVRFSTYASWWVRSAIQDYVLRNWSIVRTGTTSAQKTLFFNLRRLRNRIEEASGAPLDNDGRDAIATQLGVGRADVVAMEGRLGGGDESLNAPVAEGSETEAESLLADPSPSPEMIVLGLRDAATRSRWLAEALGELNPREREIIRQRRLTEQGATLEALGREFGVSKERVRQLESRALGKLKVAFQKRAENVSDLFSEGI